MAGNTGDTKMNGSQDEQNILRKKFKYLLHQSDDQAEQRQNTFMKELRKNITKGKLNLVMTQLDLLKEFEMGKVLVNYPGEELSPLQLAIFFDLRRKQNREQQAEVTKAQRAEVKDTGQKVEETNRQKQIPTMDVIGKMVDLCPDLIWKAREGRFAGQTVLHVAITTGNEEAAEFVLKKEGKRKKGHGVSLLHTQATGPAFRSNVMMGELPLSVAALTFNDAMVDFLLKKGAILSRKNSRGDTVFHSLVRYVAHFRERVENAAEIFEKAADTIRRLNKDHEEGRDVWMIENKEGMTPLRLAAALAQPELFKLILNLGGVYRHLDSSDGLFDSVLYDITELDPLALRDWTKKLAEDKRKGQSLAYNGDGPEIMQTKNYSHNAIQKMVGKVVSSKEKLRKVSVLEIVCETKPGKDLLGILNTDVVKEIIREKWHSYKYWFLGWAVLHSFFMILLSAHTVVRFRVPSGEALTAERVFVTAVSIMCLGAPVVVWPLELMMKIARKQPYKLTLLHHNGIYRLALLFFSLCLLVDGIWYLSRGPTNNYIALLALVSGWWFMLFFLRPFKRFSFYTVMLQRIFVGDMLRFSVVMVLMWACFSVAMYSTYNATGDELPESFSSLWRSMLTMFQLLVGMADTGDALPTKDWLPVLLYTIFVLMTFVLMLNALIAMMSSTCASVYESRDVQWELQRLSVVLLLENLLPFSFLRHCCGKPNDDVTRFDFRSHRQFKERRYFLQVYTAQSSKSKPHQASKSDKPTEDDNDIDDDDPLTLLAAFARGMARNDNDIGFDILDKKKPASGKKKRHAHKNSGISDDKRDNSVDDDQSSTVSDMPSVLGKLLAVASQDDAESGSKAKRATPKRNKKSSTPADSGNDQESGATRQDEEQPAQRSQRPPSLPAIPDVYYITPADRE